MERVNRILKHTLFLQHLEANHSAEVERRFCRHNMVHFLDVARIGRIINQEEQLGIPLEWIYAAALLHDLGKHQQYEDGTPHELAGARIAPIILRDCGFDERETDIIVDAIRGHRDVRSASCKDLRGILYRADKASRACFACEAKRDCDWKEDKKNLQIRY